MTEEGEKKDDDDDGEEEEKGEEEEATSVACVALAREVLAIRKPIFGEPKPGKPTSGSEA